MSSPSASRGAPDAERPAAPAGPRISSDARSRLRPAGPGPEFSPAMLRLFLHARALHAVRAGLAKDAKAVRASIRRAAGVTVAQEDMAWMGQLGSAAPRLKLWGALGVVVSESVLTRERASPCAADGASHQLGRAVALAAAPIVAVREHPAAGGKAERAPRTDSRPVRSEAAGRQREDRS